MFSDDAVKICKSKPELFSFQYLYSHPSYRLPALVVSYFDEKMAVSGIGIGRYFDCCHCIKSCNTGWYGKGLYEKKSIFSWYLLGF
jgi:hypothetical protein